MSIKMGDTSLSEERYIELKKLAYDYYDKYNELDRVSRKDFLDSIPSLNTHFEDLIVRTTLLFPDTEDLLKISKGSLHNVLKEIANNEDGITNEDVLAKSVEYSTQRVKELINEGKLKVMERIKYPETSISEKEYVALKKEALKYRKAFLGLSIVKKSEMIEECAKDASYQECIQLATLLIPNDSKVISMMKNHSNLEIADKYNVPVSVIEFKRHEYNYQGTEKLIEKGLFEKSQDDALWNSSDLDDNFIDAIWDQSFYKGIEEEQQQQVTKNLVKIYSKAIKN